MKLMRKVVGAWALSRVGQPPGPGAGDDYDGSETSEALVFVSFIWGKASVVGS